MFLGSFFFFVAHPFFPLSTLSVNIVRKGLFNMLLESPKEGSSTSLGNLPQYRLGLTGSSYWYWILGLSFLTIFCAMHVSVLV